MRIVKKIWHFYSHSSILENNIFHVSAVACASEWIPRRLYLNKLVHWKDYFFFQIEQYREIFSLAMKYLRWKNPFASLLIDMYISEDWRTYFHRQRHVTLSTDIREMRDINNILPCITRIKKLQFVSSSAFAFRYAFLHVSESIGLRISWKWFASTNTHSDPWRLWWRGGSHSSWCPRRRWRISTSRSLCACKSRPRSASCFCRIGLPGNKRKLRSSSTATWRERERGCLFCRRSC